MVRIRYAPPSVAKISSLGPTHWRSCLSAWTSYVHHSGPMRSQVSPPSRVFQSSTPNTLMSPKSQGFMRTLEKYHPNPPRTPSGMAPSGTMDTQVAPSSPERYRLLNCRSAPTGLMTKRPCDSSMPIRQRSPSPHGLGRSSHVSPPSKLLYTWLSGLTRSLVVPCGCDAKRWPKWRPSHSKCVRR